ncbi:hypothetical protein RJT34_25501 [Clitoria ternatea]|uniref:Uncharacterized protein n=1 Tax=Clitoria ternatea TaxID=43366 RepID=A0AAN9FPW8_CLITE
MLRAYDEMNWSFSIDTLILTGLRSYFISIIESYITYSKMNVKWHKGVSNDFNPLQRLLYRDLPLYSFVLGMKLFSKIIEFFVDHGEWKPFSFGRVPSLFCLSDSQKHSLSTQN